MYDGVFEVLQWLLFLSAVPPVQLLTGWCVTAKAPPDISAISALTAVKHGNCSSLTPLLNPVRTRKSLIWPNRFVLQNSGNAELPFSVRVWGSSTRQNVFEVGTSAAYLFYAQKTSAGQLFDVNGAINCTTLNQSSDRDLKDDILVISDATKAIRKMNGYTYTLKENGMPYAGVIAQEVMEAIPEAVGSFTHYGEELQGPTVDGNELREETRYLNVDYSAVTGLLVQVARETDDRVTALEEENTTLRQNLATAGTRISTLENQVSELVALVRQLTGSEH